MNKNQRMLFFTALGAGVVLLFCGDFPASAAFISAASVMVFIAQE